MEPLAALAPAVAEVGIPVDVRLIEVNQMVAVTLGAVQQGAQLLDEGCPPSGTGTAKQLPGLLPQQAKPVQGGADGFAAARLAEPRRHKASQPLERPAGLRIGPGYGWAGGLLLCGADFLAKGCLDAGAKRGAAAGALIQQRLGAVPVVAVQPTHHRLQVAPRARGHLRGASALGDLMQNEETLTAAIMRASMLLPGCILEGFS